MEAKSTDLVAKSNTLIEASYRLTLTEQRLILAAIVESRETDQCLSGGAVTIYARDFAKLFPDVEEGSAYRQLREAASVLFRRYVTIRDIHPESGKPRVTEARWISSSSYINGLGAIQIRMAPEIVPYITRLEQEFTEYRLERIGRLSTTYAVQLYELLVQYLSIGQRKFSIDELKQRLGLGLGEYSGRTGISDFKRRVIDVSVTQINTHTDIRVSYENIKTGRTVTGLLFSILEKTAMPEPTKKKAAKPPKITREYIEKNNLARAGESWDEAFRRLAEERGQQRLVD